MDSPAEFFTKYPLINECWQSPDGQIHFNEVDAKLHAKIRKIKGQSRRIARTEKSKGNPA